MDQGNTSDLSHLITCGNRLDTIFRRVTSNKRKWIFNNQPWFCVSNTKRNKTHKQPMRESKEKHGECEGELLVGARNAALEPLQREKELLFFSRFITQLCLVDE
ncbi:hypothetical protein AVEN_21925-1 [Araneus ventricosus]|uniref:Uncharacterized protein n=1 Tax=Araneus ventricosus TaxID=182803 RepID=A0A4Y2D4X7_ARAVE|nr:hypothetical protein AVEN_21925-1 [Araneus ventricosus]